MTGVMSLKYSSKPKWWRNGNAAWTENLKLIRCQITFCKSCGCISKLAVTHRFSLPVDLCLYETTVTNLFAFPDDIALECNKIVEPGGMITVQFHVVKLDFNLTCL